MELFSHLQIISGLVLKECRGAKTIGRTGFVARKECVRVGVPTITNSFRVTNPVRCLVGFVVTRKSRVCRWAEIWHAMVEMETGGSQRMPPLFRKMVWGIGHTRTRCMIWQRITFYTSSLNSMNWTGDTKPIGRICGYVWLVLKDARHVTKTARCTLTC